MNTANHIFNDDLLANEADLSRARERFPLLEHVLYHPELIDHFNYYNQRADAAKKNSRRWGKRSIVMGAIAIALAAIEIASWQLHSRVWPLLIGVIASCCGVLSVCIGALNVLVGQRKREWLHNRFMAERIRQFHFQSILALLPEMQTSLRDDAQKQAFKTSRHRLFQRFLDDFQGHIDSKFTSTVGPFGESESWLYANDQQRVSTLEHQRSTEVFFQAYRELRIRHQLAYADYKLQTDHAIFSAMPVRQTEVLENISKIGIAFLVMIHLSVLIIVIVEGITGAIGEAENIISIIFSIGIIVIAVAALATRAFQQGLQPEREVERYEQYRSTVQDILKDFDAVHSPGQKITVMHRMEQTAFEEMRGFLATNERSSFAI